MRLYRLRTPQSMIPWGPFRMGGSGWDPDDIFLDSIQRSGDVLFTLAAGVQNHSSEPEVVGGCVRGNY